MFCKTLLLFAFASYATAAPISPNLEPRQVYGLPPARPASWPQQLPGAPDVVRQWGVLYPRPSNQETPQIPGPGTMSIPPVEQSSVAETVGSLTLVSSLTTLPSVAAPPATSNNAAATSPEASSQETIPTSVPITQPSLPTSLPSSSSLAISQSPLTSLNITETPRPTSFPTFENSMTSSPTSLSSTTPAFVNSTSSLANLTFATSSSAAPSSSSSLSPIPTTSPSSPPTTTPANGQLRLSLVNNLASSNANAYISAIEASTGRVVMLTAAGTFYHLPETNSPVPQPLGVDVAIPLPSQGQSLQVAISGYVQGARVWFADGTLEFAVVSSINGPALVEPTAFSNEDASRDTNWGFVELTYVEDYGLFANLSFVDFVGMSLGLQLQTSSAATQTVPGIPRDGVQQVCNGLQRYRGKAAQYWNDLCVSDVDGRPMRVISPAVLLSQRPDAFPTFFAQYVDMVWQRYAAATLTINTQNENGNVACRVIGEELQCDGDTRGYVKPDAGDIFGCNSGPFAILESDNAVHRAVVPRLCAAFNRGTLMLNGGDVQPSLPPSSYYTARPYNVYSAVVHEVEIEGRGYAFSYDDVEPSPEENVAGTVAAADPELLTVFVGGI